VRDEDQGKAVAEKIANDTESRCIYIKTDVSKAASVAAAFETVVTQLGQVDILLNNGAAAAAQPCETQQC
jgi:NAD(P)-dependent dehydrogenase (short-subunit alcohol dehydrogenase family)